jgi:osmotically-inducible protein OsmY
MVAVIQRSAQDLRTDVIQALADRANLVSASIQAEEFDGTVILTGVVDCHARRLAAESAARDVTGVREVVNEIEIARDGKYGWRNIDLLAAARRILEWHYLFAGGKIGVAADNGSVILTGRVTSLFEREEAERAIAGLPNLCGVRNEIEVIPPRLEPDTLRAEVEATICRIIGDAASSVDVGITGRSVEIRGSARTLRDKQTCLTAVAALHGVARVEDYLRVS